ncbi:hypothetical protein VE23_09615 [Paenibacillus sp. D9]|nr:hypothetical protein VE23_09615 [Paenibacillus sp. D9]CDN45750.1 hypothetical protein BN871_IT_00040 [Paenibacillus sp. P22]
MKRINSSYEDIYTLVIGAANKDGAFWPDWADARSAEAIIPARMGHAVRDAGQGPVKKKRRARNRSGETNELVATPAAGTYRCAMHLPLSPNFIRARSRRSACRRHAFLPAALP